MENNKIISLQANKLTNKTRVLREKFTVHTYIYNAQSNVIQVT